MSRFVHFLCNWSKITTFKLLGKSLALLHFFAFNFVLFPMLTLTVNIAIKCAFTSTANCRSIGLGASGAARRHCGRELTLDRECFHSNYDKLQNKEIQRATSRLTQITDSGPSSLTLFGVTVNLSNDYHGDM